MEESRYATLSPENSTTAWQAGGALGQPDVSAASGEDVMPRPLEQISQAYGSPTQIQLEACRYCW